MIVLRKTMDEAVERERTHYRHLSSLFGNALHQTAALQKQMADWITEKGEALTPAQAAALFYSHDSKWQAEFFNVMQSVVEAHHDALPPKQYGEIRFGPGVPAGEGQWCWMSDDLDDSGFETIDAMHWHAKNRRDRASAIEARSDATPKSGAAEDDAELEEGDAHD